MESPAAACGIYTFKEVDSRIDQTGQRPGLANLLLSGPLALSQTKYVRGHLGVMSSYIFDTKNIFQVREGMLGEVTGCQVFVFQYPDEAEGRAIYQQTATSHKISARFSGQKLSENLASMVDRNNNLVLINQLGRYIAV